VATASDRHVVLGAAGGTGSAVVRELAECGCEPRVASRPMLRIAGLFNPFLRELNETLYQFERPFVTDASKFQGAFGPFEPTRHPEAVRRTVDWFRRRYTV
jgi:NAD(P)-dependent dehydrogenase (short-subunit alcohol dehydrogenase family)